MAKSISAKSASLIKYSFSDTDGGKSITDSDSTERKCEYTYGTGNFQVNSIVRNTGIVDSGANIEIDFSSYPFSSIGLNGTVTYNSIKSILISNTSTDEGIDISVMATGTNAAVDIFNGGSGNLLIKPYSSFVVNDPYSGIDVSTNSKIHIHNVATASGSTSGNASYSITVMGVI